MLKKKAAKPVLSLFVVAVAAMFMWATLVPASPDIPENVTIHSKAWPKKKKADVEFSHKKHAEEYKVPCEDCHHIYKDGKNAWKAGMETQKCDACHTVVKTGKALKDATPEEKKLSLYNAYHDNCIGCHKKHNKEKGVKDAAPAKCTACHPKMPK